MCRTGPWSEDIHFAIPYTNPTAAEYVIKMLYPRYKAKVIEKQ